MKTFRAELLIGEQLIDYMEYETDNMNKANLYAYERFENAYPHQAKAGTIKVKELK